MALDPKLAFAHLPTLLVDDLLNAFADVLKNYREHRWEPSELNGGKLCEAVYTIVEGYLDGENYASRSSKPKNMVAACARLEQLHTSANRSPRIQIPRMLVALYEIRNNRGVGHAGGDINPNQMDATVVLYMSKWLIAELVRLMHGLTVVEAAEIVEVLVEREVSIVWSSGDKRRVLKTGLTLKNQVLLLLASTNSASEAELARWLEHKRPADLRRDVLRPMHRARLLDYDEADRTLRLLPPGVEQAETLVLSLGAAAS